MKRSLLLLTLCQGLFLTNNVCFLAINGLVGLQLAPYGWMATLPITAYVLGGALAAPIVGWTQKHWERKIAFQIGILVAFFACLLCAYAVYVHSFSLLCIATVVAGYYNANAQLYRFAAGEIATPEFKERAVSWVLAGGLIGAILGPNLAKWTQHSFSTPFMGAYFVLAALALLSMAMISYIHFPAPAVATVSDSGRSTYELFKNPTFIVATTCSAIGYGLMSLLMAATPLAMQTCGFAFSDAAFVIEWHVIGMFAPGFFTGSLIKRYGAMNIMVLGIALNALCVVFALMGQGLYHFTSALFLLGVGWNFLFTASTSLLMTSYSANERDRAQSANNTAVFAVQVLAAFASGALVNTQGWSLLNYSATAPILLMLFALTWLYFKQRTLVKA